MPHAAEKKTTPKASNRLSVRLTEEQHAELFKIEEQYKVALVWVVREAIERLLRNQQPLSHVRQER